MQQVSTIEEMITLMNAHAPIAIKTLGGEVTSFDAEAKTLHMQFDVKNDFTHSGGIVQGGFVTGMLDAAMTHAIFAEMQQLVIVATLEIKVSFLEIARVGILNAAGRVVRLGRSTAFLDGELRDTDGKLLATATSTSKVIRPSTTTT